MNTRKAKAKQIILGILTAIGLWVSGHLLSGRLLFVEEIEFYPTGPLVFIFPFVFAAACTLIARYAVKKSKYTYFTASVISFFYPFAGLFMASFFDLVSRVPLLSTIAEVLYLISVFPAIAPLSIVAQMLEVLHNLPDAAIWVIMLANLIPVLAGAIISIRIVAKSKKATMADNS